MNASEHDSVIFVGNGATGGVDKLIHTLDLKKPPVTMYLLIIRFYVINVRVVYCVRTWSQQSLGVPTESFGIHFHRRQSCLAKMPSKCIFWHYLFQFFSRGACLRTLPGDGSFGPTAVYFEKTSAYLKLLSKTL